MSLVDVLWGRFSIGERGARVFLSALNLVPVNSILLKRRTDYADLTLHINDGDHALNVSTDHAHRYAVVDTDSRQNFDV